MLLFVGPQTVLLSTGPQTALLFTGPQNLLLFIGPQTVLLPTGPQTALLPTGPQTALLPTGPQMPPNLPSVTSLDMLDGHWGQSFPLDHNLGPEHLTGDRENQSSDNPPQTHITDTKAENTRQIGPI